MKLIRYLFCRMWGFLDQKHMEDFLYWDDRYRAERVVEGILSHTNHGKGRIRKTK